MIMSRERRGFLASFLSQHHFFDFICSLLISFILCILCVCCLFPFYMFFEPMCIQGR